MEFINPDWTTYFVWLLPVITFLVAWEIIWKLIALWRAAKNNHLGWFLCIAIINTAGILPIIYILTHKNARKVSS